MLRSPVMEPLKIGERVILLESRKDRQFMIELKPGRTLHTHGGVIKHDDVIGGSEGAVIKTHLGSEFIAARPTLVQKMMKVRRLTQIIYPKEACRLAIELSVAPGCRVLEIGSGSGSMTLLLATLVGASGRVYSFDRSEEFQKNAAANVAAYGLADRVEFKILEAGQPFGVADLDAAIIDLPAPWDAVRQVYDALRPGAMFGSITPNAEQLKQLHREAAEAGFQELSAKEIMERTMLVRQQEGVRPSERMNGFTGYLTFGRKLT